MRGNLALFFIISLCCICIVNVILADGGDIEPFGSTGGNPKPQYELKMNISISKEKINRSEEFILHYKIHNDKNISQNKPTPKFKYIDFLTSYFRNASDMNNPHSRIISFDVSEIKSGQFCSTDVIICAESNIKIDRNHFYLLDTLRGNDNYIMTNETNKPNKVAIIKLNKYYNKGELPGNIVLNIQNNKPIIEAANVTIISPVLPMPGELICWDINKPLMAKGSVTGNDTEDHSNLTYEWDIVYNGSNKVRIPVYHGSSTSSIDEIPLNSSSPLEAGHDYSINISAIDSERGISRDVSVLIETKNGPVWKFNVPSWEIYEWPAIMSMMAIVTLLIALTFLQTRYQKKFDNYIENLYSKYTRIDLKDPDSTYLNSTYLFGSIGVASSLYIILLSLNYKYIYDKRIYFNSLAYFELWVFIISFIFFVYFTDICFYCKGRSLDGKSKIRAMNIIFMALILFSFYASISQNHSQNVSDYLYKYYSTIVQVSGTLLGIVLGVNIVTRGRHSGDTPQDNYVTKLKYMAVLYGTLIGLSLWGLSAGANISFTPIIEFSFRTLSNLISIFVFETTLLLIPPAITSLYLLLNVNAAVCAVKASDGEAKKPTEAKETDIARWNGTSYFEKR